MKLYALSIIFISLNLICLRSARAAPEADQLKMLAHSRYFKLLLHYKKNIWNIERSEADGAEFFLSPRGKYDLDAELEAEIKAFNDPLANAIGPLRQHPQCAFPERFRYIKEQSGLTFFNAECREFEKWFSQIKPRSVSLVYAAPFMESPSSIFGHSFLRLDSSDQALLNYGISFDAITGPDPGFLYAIKGLTGFYKGLFSQMPYFLKANAYSNVDSRDLWEYELNLSEEQISRMLAHIWELGTTYFDYYFLNKNCSYQLLSLIEVANPILELRESFGPMSIPIDTIRAITKEPNNIRNRQLRPSILKQLKKRIANLSAQNRNRFYELKENISTLTSNEDVSVLDALLDFQKYASMSSAKNLNEADQKIEQSLLFARASSKQESPEIPKSFEQESPPELAHKTSSLAFGFSQNRNQKFFNFIFRPAIHDLLDSEEGYIPFSSLIIAQTEVSYLAETKQLRLEELRLAEVANLNPYTKLQRNISWQIGAKIYHPFDIDCTVGQFFGGLGLSLGFMKDQIVLYSLLNAYGEYSNYFQLRTAPAFEIGVLGELFKQNKIWLSYERRWYLPNNEFDHIKLSSSYEYHDFQLKFQIDHLPFNSAMPDQTNSLLSLGHFY